MAGRRLVDVAKLFNASKAVAQKHVALRSNQLDAYSKTSTLAKAVKNQTDRVTLTAAAAIALSRRFREDAPAYAKAAAEQATSRTSSQRTQPRHEDIPHKGTVKGDGTTGSQREGLEQDHHYDRSEHNTSTNPPPTDDLEIEQEQATRRPLPDGTIPTAGVGLDQEGNNKYVFSERPLSDPPKQPLSEEQSDKRSDESEGLRPVESDDSTIPLPGKPRGGSSTFTESIPSHTNDLQPSQKSSQIEQLQAGHDRDVFYSRSVESQPPSVAKPLSQIPKHMENKQLSDEHVNDKALNQDVYYSSPTPDTKMNKGEDTSIRITSQEEEQIPEGINTDVFHSPRVAKMLGSDPSSRKEYLKKRGPNVNPFIPPQYQAGHGHDTRVNDQSPYAKATETAAHSQPETTKQAIQDLASKLEKDAQKNASAMPEVCLVVSGAYAC